MNGIIFLHVSSDQLDVTLDYKLVLNRRSLQSPYVRSVVLRSIFSLFQSYYFPASLEPIIPRLLQKVKSALMIFFFPTRSPFHCDSLAAVHRSAQAAVAVGDSDVLEESEELTGLSWQAGGRWKLWRSPPLQGLEALSREEVLFRTADGH